MPDPSHTPLPPPPTHPAIVAISQERAEIIEAIALFIRAFLKHKQRLHEKRESYREVHEARAAALKLKRHMLKLLTKLQAYIEAME